MHYVIFSLVRPFKYPNRLKIRFGSPLLKLASTAVLNHIPNFENVLIVNI